jgi:hypothetical protein
VDVPTVLNNVLIVLGAGFLIANTRLILEYSTYRRRRSTSLLTWSAPKPPYYGLALGIGVVLACVALFKIFVLRRQAFGEAMMFLYYGYLVPHSRRIGRGFYEDGIWGDSSFIPYNEIGGISWREGEHQVRLIVNSRLKNLARTLVVPMEHYGAARRLLRDKIAAHDIHFTGTGLDLEEHDEREDI